MIELNGRTYWGRSSIDRRGTRSFRARAPEGDDMIVTIGHEPTTVPGTIHLRIGDRLYMMDEIVEIVARHHETAESGKYPWGHITVNDRIYTTHEAATIIAHHQQDRADVVVGLDPINVRDTIRVGDVPRLSVQLADDGVWVFVVDDQHRVRQDATLMQWIRLLSKALTTQP